MYFTVPYGKDKDFIDWDYLGKLKPEKELKYVRHLRLKEPVSVKVDGRSGHGVIYITKTEKE